MESTVDFMGAAELPYQERILALDHAAHRIERVLEETGFDVLTARSLDEARLHLSRAVVDVALLSIEHHTAAELIELMRFSEGVQSDCRVVIVSNKDSLEKAQSVVAVGASQVFVPGEGNLLRTLETVLAPSRMQARLLMNDLQLAQQNQELREVNELLANNMAITAHDIRSPLSSIIGSAQVMIKQEVPPDKQREFAQNIYDVAVRLDKIVATLLDAARIEAGRLRLDRQRVSVRELIEKALTISQPQATGHTVTLNCDPSIQVEVDPIRALQILFNVIGNAIKYSPAGSAITITVRSQVSFVVIEVSDEGHGIDSTELPHVFDRFFRSQNDAVRSQEGHGIGLYIVKTFVEMMGGRVWARSTVGEGATFGISLPIA